MKQVITSPIASHGIRLTLLFGFTSALMGCFLVSSVHNNHQANQKTKEESRVQYAKMVEKAKVLNEPALMADIKLLEGKIISSNTPGVYDFNCLVTYINAQKNRDKRPSRLSAFYRTCVKRCSYGSNHGENKALSAKYNGICTKLEQDVTSRAEAERTAKAIARGIGRINIRYKSFLEETTTPLQRNEVLPHLQTDLRNLKREFPKNQEVATLVNRYQSEIEKRQDEIARADRFLKRNQIVSLFKKRAKLRKDIATLGKSAAIWERYSREQKTARARRLGASRFKLVRKMIKTRTAKLKALNRRFDRLAKTAKVL